MAASNQATPEILDRIVKLAQHFSTQEVAEIVGYGYDTCNRAIQMDKAAASGNLEFIRNSSYPISMKTWACEKYKLTLVEDPKEEPKVEPKDNTATAIALLIDKLSSVAANLIETNKLLNAIGSRVGNLATQQGEADKRLLDAINANTDIVCGYIKEHKDVLNGIKVNTRPRRKEE